ncbi:MAG: hypothetical protein H6651_13430 [Ardenticatenales bacterium]|nr:hypothetical protein [Ardenticatenales bacterium]
MPTFSLNLVVRLDMPPPAQPTGQGRRLPDEAAYGRFVAALAAAIRPDSRLHHLE